MKNPGRSSLDYTRNAPAALNNASSSGPPRFALSSVSPPQTGQCVCQCPSVNSGTLNATITAQLKQTIGCCIELFHDNEKMACLSFRVQQTQAGILELIKRSNSCFTTS